MSPQRKPAAWTLCIAGPSQDAIAARNVTWVAILDVDEAIRLRRRMGMCDLVNAVDEGGVACNAIGLPQLRHAQASQCERRSHRSFGAPPCDKQWIRAAAAVNDSALRQRLQQSGDKYAG